MNIGKNVWHGDEVWCHKVTELDNWRNISGAVLPVGERTFFFLPKTFWLHKNLYNTLKVREKKKYIIL